MRAKRIYFETEETKTTRKKGWIDIDMDYTQIYDCFNVISPKIKHGISYQLLFWVLANKTSEENGTDFSIETHRQFSAHSEAICPGSSVSYRSFLRSVKELHEAGALTKIAKGHYYANPNMFWKDELMKRVEMLQLEKKSGDYESINPISSVEETQEEYGR